MSSDKKVTEFYNRLRLQLEGDTTWPALYLYKFIVPASLEKTAMIEVIFDGTNAEISTRESSKGTFTSFSIKVKMDSPNAVIQKYKEVSKIEGVISL